MTAVFFADADKLVYESPLQAKYDPVALHRKLVIAGGGKLNEWLTTWGDDAAAEVDVARAEESLVAAARSAFGLKPFDAEGGCGDRTALNCLCHFLEWTEGKDFRGR